MIALAPIGGIPALRFLTNEIDNWITEPISLQTLPTLFESPLSSLALIAPDPLESIPAFHELTLEPITGSLSHHPLFLCKISPAMIVSGPLRGIPASCFLTIEDITGSLS